MDDMNQNFPGQDPNNNQMPDGSQQPVYNQAQQPQQPYAAPGYNPPPQGYTPPPAAYQPPQGYQPGPGPVPYANVMPVAVYNPTGKAIAGLITGILSIVFCWIPFIGIILGIVGIVTGNQGRRSTSKGMAMAGLATGIVGIVLSVIMWIFTAAILAAL